MTRLFYNLGRKVGPKVRKAKWIWQSMTGTEADAIKIENEVGRDLAYEVRNQLGRGNDPKIGQLLNDTGHTVADCVANKLRVFSFEAVDNGEPNAFALPGGFIFVTASLVELCQRDKDELAFILGHEMAHVIRGHAMNRIISDSAISAASRVTPVRGALSGWLRKVGIQFLESTYSQELESEADQLGVRLMAAAGYDSRACISLFRRLAKFKGLDCELPSDNGQDVRDTVKRLGSYFSSHPPFNVRIENINVQLRLLQQQALRKQSRP